MATCKDCIHYDVCLYIEISDNKEEDYYTEFGCEYFENKADFAEVKHGKWLKTDAYPHHVYCSLCYRDYVTNEEVIQGRREWQPPAYCTEAEYCPHCGAKMDEERKNTGKKQ